MEILEFGIRIHLNIVATALAPFELDMELLRRTVGRAQETRPGCNGGLIHLGCGGPYAARVMLRGALQAAHLQTSGPSRFQRAEVGGCERPDRQLVLDEFVEFVHKGELLAFICREALVLLQSKVWNL